MHRFIAVVVLTVFVPTSQGQDKKPAKAESFPRVFSETRRFLAGRPTNPQPTSDGTAVLFLRSGPRSPQLQLFEFDVATGKTRTLLTPDDVLKGGEEKLSPEEKALRERKRILGAGFTSFQLSRDGAKILLSLAGRLYLVNREKNAVRELKTGVGPLLDPKFSPDLRWVSYVRDNDVHLYDLAADKEIRLTKEGTEEVSHGLAEFVAQEEMDRFSGYWWSPDSKRILFQENDARAVETWYVADPSRPGSPPTPFFYPRPGQNNVKVKLLLASVPDGKVSAIDWDAERYPYLVSVRWEGKGPPACVVQTRDQKKLTLFEIDPKTGVTTPLLSEEDPAWVNIHQEGSRWLEKRPGFLWVSERDGAPRLELRTPKGKLAWVVVPAHEGYQDLVGVDEERGLVYYLAGPNPTETHLYRVALDPLAEAEALTKDKGVHTAVLAREGGLYVVTSRRWEEKKPAAFMPRSAVHDAGTLKEVGELPHVAEDPPFAPRVDLVQVGEQEFHAAVVLPRDFDSRKSYPVLLDVYGGPNHVHVEARKDRWLLNQWFADQGFIVVAVDGRGTPRRGRDWERAIHHKFGSVPLDDQIAALLAAAKRYPAMDLKRVGVSGWSFGGYMAAQAVLARPDVFHVGVAGAPVTDWYDYDTHYTERFLGVPPETNDAYEQGSLLPLAKELRRPLLLIHGTADDNVYFRHSLKLADALLRHGQDFELVPMSGFTHRVTDPAAYEQMQLRIARFLTKHLGGPK